MLVGVRSHRGGEGSARRALQRARARMTACIWVGRGGEGWTESVTTAASLTDGVLVWSEAIGALATVGLVASRRLADEGLAWGYCRGRRGGREVVARKIAVMEIGCEGSRRGEGRRRCVIVDSRGELA